MAQNCAFFLVTVSYGLLNLQPQTNLQIVLCADYTKHNLYTAPLPYSTVDVEAANSNIRNTSNYLVLLLRTQNFCNIHNNYVIKFFFWQDSIEIQKKTSNF